MPSAVTPTVLRNRGVPVTVAVLAADATSGKMVQATSDDGTILTEERFVRVTNNTLADIEDTWGDMAGFAKATAEKPVGAIRKFLSLCWEEPVPDTGLRMLPEHKDTYTGACAAALMIAQGVDPTVAAKMLETGVRTSSAQAAVATSEAATMLAELDEELTKVTAAMPGPSSAETGSDSASTSETSGT